MGITVIGTVPFSGNILRFSDTFGEILPDEFIEFPVSKLLLVLCTSPVGDIATPLTTNWARTPDHREIEEIRWTVINM